MPGRNMKNHLSLLLRIKEVTYMYKTPFYLFDKRVFYFHTYFV